MGKNRHFSKIQFLPYKERIGNISVSNFWMDENGVPKPYQSHSDKTPFSYFSIDKQYPNSYYGTESEYEWDEVKQMYKVKGGYSAWISPSCFVNPESRFTLAAWMNVDHDELTPDLKFVGNRPFELDEEETKAFMELAKRGQAHIQKVLEESYNNQVDDY
jgi:hypothetical protein